MERSTDGQQLIIPQQLACPRCGCLLAYIDTDVLKKCPGCGIQFDEQTRPVAPSDAPRPDKYTSPEPEVEPHGCWRLLFGYFAIMAAYSVTRSHSISDAIFETVQLCLWSLAFASRRRQTWRSLAVRGGYYFALFLALAWMLKNAYFVFGAAIAAGVIGWSIKRLSNR